MSQSDTIALIVNGCLRLLPLQCGEVGLDLVILGNLCLDVVVNADEFLVQSSQPCTTKSIVHSTFCKESISSANDLSALYLTLFHANDRKYWSAGSVTPLVKRHSLQIQNFTTYYH